MTWEHPVRGTKVAKPNDRWRSWRRLTPLQIDEKSFNKCHLCNRVFCTSRVLHLSCTIFYCALSSVFALLGLCWTLSLSSNRDFTIGAVRPLRTGSAVLRYTSLTEDLMCTLFLRRVRQLSWQSKSKLVHRPIVIYRTSIYGPLMLPKGRCAKHHIISRFCICDT